MFKTFNSVKTLKTVIKLAAVALTSPATVAVAGSLYPSNPITRVIVSIAALILVEGCLLLGWQMLDDYGKSATTAQRALYASLAWVAYLSLFGIALYHQEGMAGLAFRLTLGVMLVYASAEAGLLAELRQKDRTDRDIHKDPAVKRYARKLARQEARADLLSESKLHQLEREAKEQLASLRVRLETEADVRTLKRAVSKSVDLAKSTAKADSLEIANRTRKLSKQQALRRTTDLLKHHPDITPTQIAAEIGKSRGTVYDYLSELTQSPNGPING